ncbi:Poly [ADP-ribose] polymerase [Portunus trituberculatus]|uniref:Poly [ADP-ribose] polymerase n=1 Tax=Portunus trituberculatus TaxID=210409 RepID=A0A5B7EJU0_PORTR|nr:Poly [ADP-ribose] polymerase [Portunus trituberculatus]
MALPAPPSSPSPLRRQGAWLVTRVPSGRHITALIAPRERGCFRLSASVFENSKNLAAGTVLPLISQTQKGGRTLHAYTLTNMDEELPFKAEYAKSGRASCRGCKQNIAKDSLRLAAMVQLLSKNDDSESRREQKRGYCRLLQTPVFQRGKEDEG